MTTLDRWRGEELYSWGRRGLKLRNGRSLPSPRTGRRCRYFDPAWLGDWDKLPAGTHRRVYALRRLTDDVFPVRERRGRNWPRTHYIAPAWAVAKVKAEHTEAEPYPLAKGESFTVPFGGPPSPAFNGGAA